LEGAGNVLDTINLLGTLLSMLVIAEAALFQVPKGMILESASLDILQAKSIKAGIDLDWNQPHAEQLTLRKVLSSILRFHDWLRNHQLSEHSYLQKTQRVLRKVWEQNVEFSWEQGDWTLIQGVAKQRIISATDTDMAHGRKSKIQNTSDSRL
jgi:hypothetical protein